MKRFINKQLILIISIIAGGAIGFLYWKNIGCSAGSCLISSQWYTSTIYGAVMGGLFVRMFQKEEPKENIEE